MRFASSSIGLLALALASRASATPVACSNPADLCSGDPCVVPAVELPATCNLDFGARALVLSGRVTVPDGGVVTFHAGSIDVHAPIDNTGATGAHVTLNADGAITQLGRIRAVGRTTPGRIELHAGGDIALAGNVQASAGGRSAPGGYILLDAGGTAGCPHGCRLDVRGTSGTPAGTALIRGAAGVYMPIGTHLDGGGRSGGTFEMSSAHGAVYDETDVRAKATKGPGGRFLVQAATAANVVRDISMDGGTGGSVTIAAPTVLAHGMLHAIGRSGVGGTVDVSGDRVEIHAEQRVDGRTQAGTVSIRGGTVTVAANGSARAPSGGTLRYTTTSGSLTLTGRFDATKGGTFTAQSAGDLTLRGSVRTAGGCIGVHAAGTPDTSGATFDGPIGASCP